MESSRSMAQGDRNLLFGILAFQMDLISRDALVAAIRAWIVDKSKPLDEVLVEQGALAGNRRSILCALVEEHAAQRKADPEQTLIALPLPPALRHDLEQLADSAVNAGLGRLLDSKSPAEETTSPYPGEKPASDGRFDILRRHAWGGLGEVYVAQDRELHREVALKRLQERHADNQSSRARFVQEAEVTGGLEHPGIVPVYGLGTSSDGRPYYAMRFIRGQTLKEAIDEFYSAKPRTESERRIELRQLLTRFIAVCNAIEYAHSRGVIHRDIKPSNIMLGKYGETLVVDWGLAKALGHRGDAATDDEQTLIPSTGSGSSETLPGFAIGTPQYMSPEQADGRVAEISTASDVYSLGATLYAILTGKSPFDAPVLGVVLGKVQAGDFRPPREVNSAVSRGLNAICLKAMSLEPRDRYASCSALADDVEHWLADEPITALRDPISDRAVRWIKRHRVMAAATAAVVVVALLGLAIGATLLGRANSQIREAVSDAENQRDDATRQRRRAEENSQQARHAVDRYYTLISESRLIDVPGAEPLRKELLNAALEYYRNLPSDDSQDAEVQAELAAANFRMCIIENLTGATNWLPDFKRGLVITEKLVASNTPIEKFKSFDAGVADISGQLLRIEPREIPEAMDLMARAIAVWERLLSERPRSVGIRNDLAAMYGVLANLKFEIIVHDVEQKPKLWPEAYRFACRARDLWKEAASEQPNRPRFRAALAIELTNIGNFHLLQGQFTEFAAVAREAAELQEALVRERPDAPHYRFDLARTYEAMALASSVTRSYCAAVEAKSRELAIRAKMTADFPTVSRYRDDLLKARASARELVQGSLLASTSEPQGFRCLFDLSSQLSGEERESRTKQLSGSAPESVATPLVGGAAAPLAVTFPAPNSDLEKNVFSALKQMFDRTPKDARNRLVAAYVERGTDGARPGANSYRQAAAALRWWAGGQRSAVTLLESYVRQRPNDPNLVLALAQALSVLPATADKPNPEPRELLDELFQCLSRPSVDRDSARQIVQFIRLRDPDGRAAERRWIGLLGHEEAGIRRFAIGGLPTSHAAAQRFAPAVEKCLTDTDSAVRVLAARYVWETLHDSTQATPILIAALKDASAGIRLGALQALAEMGPAAESALPALKALTDEANRGVRLARAAALWRVAKDASGISPLVKDFRECIKQSSDQDASFLQSILGLWSEMGPAALEALPLLSEVLTTRASYDEKVFEVIRTIQQIDPKGTHSELSKFDRRLWKGGHSQFERVQPRRWRETALQNPEEHHDFEEVAVTAAYVELYDPDRPTMLLRLQQRDASLRDTDWHQFQTGTWMPAASKAATEHSFWQGEHSRFEQTGPRKWRETVTNDAKETHDFDEIKRTDSTVEIVDPSRSNLRIRLDAGVGQVLDEDWHPFQTGSWSFAPPKSSK